MTIEEETRFLIDFIGVMKDGLPKPYDPAPFVNKVKRLARGGELDALLTCCPPTGHIRDAKDLKPFIIAAARKVALNLKLEVDE